MQLYVEIQPKKHMNPYSKIDFKKKLESISPEVIKRQNLIQQQETDKIYKKFIRALKKGKCFLCYMKMDKFDISKPCLHWFTYPKGIKKKHFENYLNSPLSFFRLDSYFRWLANTEVPIGNINDMKQDTSETSFLETTIKYKNIEWAFSIGHTDKEGHQTSRIANKPHYHIQMKVNDMIFLKFNDYHIEFTDDDLFMLEAQKQDVLTFQQSYGTGMSIIEDEETLKFIDEYTTVPENENSAPFRRQTLIMAQPGKTIPGELIKKAIEESERTKIPVGKIMRKYLDSEGASINTVISPSENVTDMAKRSGKK